MAIWTLADLHLAFGNPAKSMEVFGPCWKDYPNKIEQNWRALVAPEDLVLIPGDLSWATKLGGALIDLEWIDRLPGEKLIIRGNHDYWWPSASKLKKALPPSIHFIHNNALELHGITFGGSRLWDSDEYSFNEFIEFVDNPRAKEILPEDHEKKQEEDARIFERELERLRRSLEQLPTSRKCTIALTHYPPIGADLAPSKASAILEEFGVDICVFGHLHNVRKGSLPFGTSRGVRYIFASADYLGFRPLKVLD